MTGIKELSDGGPDGTRLGQSASDLIGFHGKAPSDQRAFTASATVVGTTATPYGFSSSAEFTAAMTLLNELKLLIVEKGLMAAS
jgi:hypothetical protein